MTGFEVVGVLLALYPLLIDGIRLYQKAKSGQLLSDLLKDVLEEHIIFHDWVGHLLERSVPIEQLQDLLNPKSRTFARWNDSQLHQAIEQSYGTLKAMLLLETLNDAHEELQAIKADLSTLKPSTDSFRSRVTTTLKTARHSREGSHLRERLARLQKLNARFGNVCQMSRVHRPLMDYAGVAPVKFNTSLPEHASNIHKAIQDAHTCQCSQPHLTKLCLPMTLDSRHVEFPPPSRPYFEILFSMQDEEDLQYERSSSDQLELSMILSDTSINSPLPETDSQNQSPSASTATLTRRDSIFSKINSNVSTNSSVARLNASKGCSFVVTEASAGCAGEIGDICSVINRNEHRQIIHGSSASFGTLPSAGSSRYELQLLRDSQIPAASTMTSLEDIFIGNEFRLARKHRLALALRLSMAIVQFSSTPWIGSHWKWENFSILDLHNTRLEDVRLYVAHSFFSSRDGVGQPASWPRSTLAIIPGEEVLVRLGCALVELAFGRRLSSIEGQLAISSDSDMRDLIMAHAIVESGRLLVEESETYHNVVRTCLKQAVPQGYGWKSLNRNDPSFQQDAMRAIVEPLHQLWRA